MEREAWLEEAMERWEVPLLRTCWMLLKDATLAEDAVQETFVKAWKAYGSYRGESSEKNWLMRIAMNTCRDLQRGPWFRRVEARSKLPEAAVPFTQRDDTVTRAVLDLPDKLRQVVVLRFYQGMTVKEVAQAARMSPRTVHNRLKEAEERLKEQLEDWYHA